MTLLAIFFESWRFSSCRMNLDAGSLFMGKEPSMIKESFIMMTELRTEDSPW